MSFHVIHLPEEQRKDTCVWGVVLENKVIAKIETTPEKEKNLLYITAFWVTEEYRSQGIGHALLAVVKEQAELERRKAVVMELPCESETVESLLAKDGFWGFFTGWRCKRQKNCTSKCRDNDTSAGYSW